MPNSAVFRSELKLLNQLFPELVGQMGKNQFEQIAMLFLCDRDITTFDNTSVSQCFYEYLTSPGLSLSENLRELARWSLFKRKSLVSLQVMMTHYDFSKKNRSWEKRMNSPLYLLIYTKVQSGSTSDTFEKVKTVEIDRSQFFIFNWLRRGLSFAQIKNNLHLMGIKEIQLQKALRRLGLNVQSIIEHSKQIEIRPTIQFLPEIEPLSLLSFRMK